MLAFHAPPEAVTMPVTRYGKIPGRISVAPAIPAPNRKMLRRFFQIGRNRHRAGNHVEQDVPLRAQQHQHHRRDPSPPRNRIRNSKITGNSAVAGIEAAICASGCAMRASFAD